MNPDGQGSYPRPHQTQFECEVAHVAGGLQRALAALVQAVPGAPKRATDLQRHLKLGTEQSWQVFRTATAADPLEASLYVPKRGSMEKVLKAAKARRMPAEVVTAVAREFDEFERMIDRHAPDRDTFEHMASVWSPDARAKADLVARKAVFNGMSQIKGACCDTFISASILVPSAVDSKLDLTKLHAVLGMRRLRPEGFGGSFGDHYPKGFAPNLETVEGTLKSDAHDGMLTQFCSTPTPRFEIHTRGEVLHSTLISNDVGLSAAVDLVYADCMRGGPSRFALRPNHVVGNGDITEIPSRRLVLDQFVHKDLVELVDPRVVAHDTSARGVVQPFDAPERFGDRLELFQGLATLGRGLASFRALGIPRYVDMLRYVCEKLKYDPNNLRGYRFDIEYPVSSGQYMIGFDLPERPTSA
jgi:hypothetical protein